MLSQKKRVDNFTLFMQRAGAGRERFWLLRRIAPAQAPATVTTLSAKDRGAAGAAAPSEVSR